MQSIAVYRLKKGKYGIDRNGFYIALKKCVSHLSNVWAGSYTSTYSALPSHTPSLRCTRVNARRSIDLCGAGK